MASQRISSLDGLRGIAILEVILWHYFAFPASHARGRLSHVFFTLTQFTWSGVDLFFVLSGFLIGGILISAKESGRYFSTFYIRRACRILPIYVAIMATMTVCYLARPGITAVIHRPMPWIVYLTFTQNFWLARRTWDGWNVFLAVTWSLAVEEQFYLMLPTLVRITPRKHLTRVVLAIMVATPLLRTVLFLRHDLPATFSYVMLYCRTDALMLGVFGAIIVRNQQWMDMIRGNRWIMRSLLALSFPPLLVMAWRHWGVGAMGMSTVGFSFLAFFYFLMLIEIVSNETGMLAKFCSTRFLTWSGLLAYGLYLLHLPVLDIVNHLARSHHPAYSSAAYFAVSAAALVVTFSLASLSWYQVETRFIKIGHSFTYGKRRTAQPLETLIVVAPAPQPAGEEP